MPSSILRPSLLLSGGAICALLAAPAAAQTATTDMARIEQLEAALEELMARDAEKTQRIIQLQQAVREMERPRPAATAQPHAHSHAETHEHDHGHDHDHAHDHAGGHHHEPDVLFAGDGYKIYLPGLAFDGFFYKNNRDRGAHALEDIAGFGGHAHDHAHTQDGFNLRHLEGSFAGQVGGMLDLAAIVNYSEADGVELEEGFVRTVPHAGFQVTAGKFLSDFGLINGLHSHEWDFADQPLIYKQTLGDHGLSDLGAQLTWSAPTSFPLTFGGEVFQGDNDLMVASVDDEHLPDEDGPRLFVGWVTAAPWQQGPHRLQLGASIGHGSHQEAHGDHGHEEEEHEHEHEHEHGGEEEATHWLDGDSTFYGVDARYHYDAGGRGGAGDLTLQGEYFYRTTDLELVAHHDAPEIIGSHVKNHQDGYYMQALYGFLPDWRAGLRWEQIGLTNETETPLETIDYGSSHRATAMVDWAFNDWALLRLQGSAGEFERGDGGSDDIYKGYAQLVVRMGGHIH